MAIEKTNRTGLTLKQKLEVINFIENEKSARRNRENLSRVEKNSRTNCQIQDTINDPIIEGIIEKLNAMRLNLEDDGPS